LTDYPFILLAVLLVYLGILFLIAYSGERHVEWLNRNRWQLLYILSAQVYCTSWTFYGSIGFASHYGIEYLAVYTGPVLILLLTEVLLMPILRHVKREGVTTVSDFLSSRYGGSRSIAVVTSMVLFMSIIPYIGLQVQALSNSFSTLASGGGRAYIEATLIVLIFLAVVAILYGGRYIDFTRPQYGLMSTVAFQSLDKLVFFLIASVFIVFVISGGPLNIFHLSVANPDLKPLMFTGFADHPYLMWASINISSAIAYILLPRQFHTIFVQNRDEKHLKTLAWFSPLYLLMINLFVIPIALSGNLFGLPVAKADDFILTIPLKTGYNIIALVVFLGGFSAAASMILVESIAVSKMLVTDIGVPGLMSIFRRREKQVDLYKLVLYSTRIAIPLIILLGFFYSYFIGRYFMLVEIGLTSFVGVAQLAPSFLIGLFYKDGNKKGALAGTVTGTVVWLYTMIIPALSKAEILPAGIAARGPFGIRLLSPLDMFGVFNSDPITNALFWSLFLNVMAYLLVSAFTRRAGSESHAAARFFNISGEPEEPLAAELVKIQSELGRLLTPSVGPATAKSIVAEAFTLDSSKLSRMLEEFRAALEKEKRLASIGELSASIAHDLRSPIGAIRLSMGTLEELAKDNPEGMTTINNAKAAMTRIEKLVNDILWYSKADVLNKVRICAKDAIDDTIELLRKEIEIKRISVHVYCEDSVVFWADATRIGEVLTNLISNAIEAVEEKVGSISVSATTDDQNLTFEIADNGKGINPQALGKVFTPFYTTKSSGTGLGLPIVKRLVNAHGGDVRIESDEGAGTRVILVFPRTDFFRQTVEPISGGLED
jgi:signal transduction histidine kinase